jgi:hypothetical protein
MTRIRAPGRLRTPTLTSRIGAGPGLATTRCGAGRGEVRSVDGADAEPPPSASIAAAAATAPTTANTAAVLRFAFIRSRYARLAAVGSSSRVEPSHPEVRRGW